MIAPPRRLTTRLLSVGPIPPEWGGRLRGGVTRFHATLLDELRERPWRLRVEPVGVLIPPPKRVPRHRVRRRSPLPVFMQPEGGRPRRFTRLLVERTEPDVVLVNNVAAFAGARFVRVLRQVAPEVPIVGVIHAWHPITMKRDARRAEANRRNTERALRNLDGAIYGSEHCRREGLDLGLPSPAVCEVVHHPVGPAFADPALEVGGRRQGVAFVGSYIPRKNAGALIEAVAATPGLRLTLAGRGGEEERLRQLATERGASERISFAPYVEGPGHVTAIRELMASAEVLCLPSLSESFGIVMIEALAAGTPVVGFGPTFAEIRERLGIDCGEPLHEGKPEEIAAALRRVQGRDWDRRRLRERALAAFSPRAVAGRYASLLRGVARD